MTITMERLQQLIDENVTLHHMNDQELSEDILPTLATLQQSLRIQLLTLLERFAHNEQVDFARKERVMLELISDDYLFYNQGMLDSKDVYKRAYSMKTLSYFIDAHNNEPFIEDAAYEQLYRAVMLYIQLEEDVRSYGKEGGLVQPVAYAVDALEKLMHDERFPKEQSANLFRVLANKIACSSVLYIGDEKEVLSKAIMNLLKIHLDEKVIEDFFVRVPKFITRQQDKLRSEEQLYLYKNVTGFLYVFHLYVYRKNVHNSLLKSINHCLEKLTLQMK
ncbi:DUF2785 domain-containing protein [Kurthia huakuii]|uniref:DUF2785 domain-containing protein n=1 Tax=Kurthia huakuii TaxID=1421019 RepID=UPI0004959D7A|nr:DUF2785 domain-containing protein [Kurthia huakuii]MBM7699571.1 uncharacterized protein (DUF2164 family) [Kurthia huakuii]